MAKIGLDAKLYRGTAGSTATTEMKNVIDLSVPDEMGEADISMRGCKVALVLPTLETFSLEWSMHWDEDDADFAAILAAYRGRTPIALAAYSSDDGEGPDADFVITKCQRTETLKEGVKADIVAKPTYAGDNPRYPTWGSGTGGGSGT